MGDGYFLRTREQRLGWGYCPGRWFFRCYALVVLLCNGDRLHHGWAAA